MNTPRIEDLIPASSLSKSSQGGSIRGLVWCIAHFAGWDPYNLLPQLDRCCADPAQQTSRSGRRKTTINTTGKWSINRHAHSPTTAVRGVKSSRYLLHVVPDSSSVNERAWYELLTSSLGQPTVNQGWLVVVCLGQAHFYRRAFCP